LPIWWGGMALIFSFWYVYCKRERERFDLNTLKTKWKTIESQQKHKKTISVCLFFVIVGLTRSNFTFPSNGLYFFNQKKKEEKKHNKGTKTTSGIQKNKNCACSFYLWISFNCFLLRSSSIYGIRKTERKTWSNICC